MRVYQFRHIRADGQCSGGFGMNRGLLALAVAALALSLVGSAAPRPPVAGGRLVELVALLDGKPLAERPHARAEIDREQASIAARISATVPGSRIRWRYQLVLNGLAVVAPADAAARIAAIPGVREVQQSVRYHRTLYQSPRVIGAPQVWGPTLATAGNGIKIGVIDDGVDQSHPFFSPVGFSMPAGYPKGNTAYTTAKVIVARSFPPPGANWRYAKLPVDPQESEHGTHVAGIAAGDYDTSARGPSGQVRVSGVAPRAYIGNYRIGTIPTNGIGPDGNSPEIAAAIEQAVRDGMNVINLSYGEPEITPSRDIVVQAMNAAADAGVVPVIAAGNDFEAVGPGSIGSPASAQKAIAVAAATKGGVIAPFSSGGPAPVSLALKPDVTAPGVGILSSVPAHDGTWAQFDGTSMASPHVAGAAALLLQRHPGWTVAQVKSALVSTGSPVVVGRARREVSPTREGGGMIWLPRADQPLVFARPASFSLGLLRRGSDLSSYFLGSDLTDAGGGAGVWQASVRPLASVRGAAVRVAATVNVPGKLTLGVDVARSARAGEGSGFVLLTRGGQTRRFPYWFRVSVPRLGGEGHTLLRRPGLYRGNTRGRPARVSSYRYPSAPGPLGVTQRLAGPEQVFRFVIHGRVENAGAVVVSEATGLTRLAAARASGERGPTRRLHRTAVATEPVQAELLRGDPGSRRLPPRARSLRPRLRHDQPSRGRALRLPLLGQRHQPARGPAADADGQLAASCCCCSPCATAARASTPPRCSRSSTAASTASSGTRRTAWSESGSRPSAAAATSWSSPSPTTRRRRTTRTRAGRCRTRGG